MHKKISQKDYPEFEKFLIIRANYTSTEGNMYSNKCKFNTIARWYEAKDLPFTIDTFTDFLYEQKKNGCNGRGASDAYLNKFRTIGKQVGRWLKIREMEDLEYAEEEQDNDFVPLTPEEIEQIANVNISYGKGGHYLNRRNKVMYLIAGLIGPRPGEMCNLRWKDVHFDGKTWYLTFKHTKTKKQRKNVIGNYLGKMLDELPRMSEEYVFTSYRGKKLTTHEYNNELKRRAKACGVTKYVNGKLLRHSAGTTMFIIGMDGFDIAENLGHDNPATTKNRYKHNDTNYFYQQVLRHPFLARERTPEVDKKIFLEILEKYFSHRERHIDLKGEKIAVELDLSHFKEN